MRDQLLKDHYCPFFVSLSSSIPYTAKDIRCLSPREVRARYMRRFSLDHWYRFAKQRLHWTLPKLSTPKQCEPSCDLMPLARQLWLARDGYISILFGERIVSYF